MLLSIRVDGARLSRSTQASPAPPRRPRHRRTPRGGAARNPTSGTAAQESGAQRQAADAARPPGSMETTDMAAPPLTEGGTATYRELNRDKTRLPRWMDDVMHRKPRWASDAYNDEPSSVTEGVRTQRARHAAVFEELRRQVRVHSPQLSKLLGKVWLGEDELVKKLSIEADKVHDTIVTSQKERNELIKQSKKSLSIVERQLSDVKYELAVSKATLREREAECASNKSLVESLNEELGALREQVGKYVEGHVDDIGDRYEALKAERMKLMTEEDPTTGEAYPLAEIERLAKNRLQGVFEMNDEVDEILAKCQRSHDSLKHGLRDLTGLVASVDPDDFRVSKSYKLKKKPSTEVGCQHVTIKVEGVRVNKSLPPPRVEEPVEEGLTMPLLLRKQMCEFPPSQRIPSLQATLRLILSLYLEKLMYDKLCDANHKRRVELGAFPHKYLLKKFGLQNLADEQCTQLVAAVAYHKDESKRVRLFGEYLGMTDFAKPPIYGVRDGNFVFGILVALRKANEFTEAVCCSVPSRVDASRASRRSTWPSESLRVSRSRRWRRHGRQRVCAPREGGGAVTAMPSSRSHESPRTSRESPARQTHTQVLQDKDQQIDINRKKAVDVMRACFKPILPDQGAKLLHRVQNLPPPSVSRNPKCIDLDDLLELTHNTWANTSSNWRTHLEFLYARHANLYRVKEEMRFANDNGILSQDVILVQEERAKNYTLRDARRPLYDLQQQGDVMTQLMKERASMDDDDLHGKKRPELVAAMPFEAFDACIREIDPYVEENDIRRIFDDCKKLQTHRIETSFQELWVRHELVDGVANINQPETEEPVLSKLMRGIEPSFETTRKMKALPRMKSPKKRKEGFDVPRAEDPEDPHAAYFWYSKEFETSVWVPPWDPKLFDVQEVERDVFLEVCLDEFLLPNSPFNSLLDKLPTDLWPNAEAYLEQLEGGETLF